MKASRVVAAATGIMIGLGGIAPAASAQSPTVATASVVAHHGHGWGVKNVRQQFRFDLRQGAQGFPCRRP